MTAEEETGFREWYNDQPYKGERLAYNAWCAALAIGRKAELQALEGIIENIDTEEIDYTGEVSSFRLKVLAAIHQRIEEGK